MQSTDIEEIEAALWEQSHHPCIRVKWGVAQVMAVRKSKKGELQALLRGWDGFETDLKDAGSPEL